MRTHLTKKSTRKPPELKARSFTGKFIESVRALVSSEAFYQKLLRDIEKIEKPELRVKAYIELTKFVHPQIAAMSIQTQSLDKPVEKIVFMPASSPAQITDSKPEPTVVDAKIVQ